MDKLIIYQVFPRIFTNTCSKPIVNGTFEQNGSGKMNDFTPGLLKSIRELGINAIWYTGIIENATKTDFSSYGIAPDNPCVVKGEAGSPYAIKDYYDVATCLAVNPLLRMQEFEQLVKRTHEAGLKIIIDFVPNHTARQYHSDSAPKCVEDFGVADDKEVLFSPSNNYYYLNRHQFAPDFNIQDYNEFPAKATGNDCFSSSPSEYDWYETVKLNYGIDYRDNSRHFDPIPSTWLKMLDILRFWASKGVDGFRCDMVFMVPVEFWNWVIPKLKQDWPETFFIGEIYDVSLYRTFLNNGCFDYLYDKVNLYDTLMGIGHGYISAAGLSDVWKTVDGIGDKMLNFLENHDEIRYASSEGIGNPFFVLPSLVYAATVNRGPMMIYYGQELGESARDNEGFAGNNNRSTIFDYWSYDTMRRWYNNGRPSIKHLSSDEIELRKMYSKVLNICNKHKSISDGSFFDLMYVNFNKNGINPDRHFAYLRHYENETLLILLNFGDSTDIIDVCVPCDAFKFANLPEGKIEVKDILHENKLQYINLIPDGTTQITVEGHNAVMLQIVNN